MVTPSTQQPAPGVYPSTQEDATRAPRSRLPSGPSSSNTKMEQNGRVVHRLPDSATASHGIATGWQEPDDSYSSNPSSASASASAPASASASASSANAPKPINPWKPASTPSTLQPTNQSKPASSPSNFQYPSPSKTASTAGAERTAAYATTSSKQDTVSMTNQRKSASLLKKKNNYLAVAGCVSAFLFLYAVDVSCVIIPWLSYSVPGITNLVVLTFSTVSGLYCYLFCTTLDPGRVPEGWSPDTEGVRSMTEVKKKGGAMRYCQKCQQYKPPRSHHCRVCQRCVLRMDHHCPAVNNCIGHGNYKSFLLMLTYTSAALAHTLGLIASHTLHMMHVNQQQQTIRAGIQSKPVHLAEDGALEHIWLWAMLQSIAFLVSLPLLVGLTMLLGWHIHLMLTNKTTIEYQEGVTAQINAELYQVQAMQVEHPYDLGAYHNLHQILGPSPSTWLLPQCVPTPGGTEYPTTWDMPRGHSLDEEFM